MLESIMVTADCVVFPEVLVDPVKPTLVSAPEVVVPR